MNKNGACPVFSAPMHLGTPYQNLLHLNNPVLLSIAIYRFFRVLFTKYVLLQGNCYT